LSKINILIKFKYLPKSGTLLDVGSGRGEYINSLPLNIKSTGIDLNPVKNNKNEVIKADFLKYKFTQKFDVITFWHSLEHFSDPQKAITKTLDLLKSKGKILIAIPNTNSLAYKIGEKNWFHLDAPRHLFLPNNQNIKYLFPKGTKINIYYTPYEFPLDLFWSLKNKKILRLIYPFLKIFDKETMLISVVKPE